MKLVFATNNNHKLKEVQNLLVGTLHATSLQALSLLSLSDIKFNEEIPENCDTLEGNASQKAFYIYNKLINGTSDGCFADDTGLEIEALNGRPGVFSARYAGESCDFDANIDKVLKEMQGVKNRKACFRTVISLVIEGREKQFEGIVTGMILKERKGESGFGYDPIFKPDGFDITYAEMPLEEKNKISHRAMAVKKLVHFLTTIPTHLQ